MQQETSSGKLRPRGVTPALPSLGPHTVTPVLRATMGRTLGAVEVNDRPDLEALKLKPRRADGFKIPHSPLFVEKVDDDVVVLPGTCRNRP